MENPTVSVLMTVFNRQDYISEAIESVVKSSYHDWELIIVDDQSTDDSVSIAQEYADKEKRISIYINETNKGDYPNRNIAASYAKGKYIKYLDSDDIIYPYGLEIMVATMEMYPEAAVGFSYNNYDGERQLPYLSTPEESFERHFFYGGFLGVGPTGSIYRREKFVELKGFKTDFGVATDIAFNLELTSQYPCAVFSRDLFWWRPHPNQEYNLKKLDYVKLNYTIHLEYLTRQYCPLSLEQKSKAINDQKNLFARRIILLMLGMNFGTALNLMRFSNLGITSYLLCMLPSKLRRRIQTTNRSND